MAVVAPVADDVPEPVPAPTDVVVPPDGDSDSDGDAESVNGVHSASGGSAGG